MAPKAVRYEIGLPPTRVGGTTGFVGDCWRTESKVFKVYRHYAEH